ncbi:IclR family transcriptional regulator [Paraburkholderia silviterrae]|uniref:IclR family transcriptional regulator n=1 Tax=Paraburkholderia silviterrae TaxID=2528715 RepID=A0A4R5MF44_9BURK|nr:IclR family transcriptional regulator [Paraburkholderia silviterrae]TDG25554.1 IclR family transcriptional regulator [Paraburkholderia silviterrae]
MTSNTRTASPEKCASDSLVSDNDALTDGDGDRHFVTALARGLDVLRCFRSGDTFLANHEIAERCQLPRSTITRLTYTLTKLGYLYVMPETGKYRLGAGAIALGSAMLVKLDVRQIARPLMQDLAADVGSLVALATRDRTAMLHLECCRANSVVTLNMDVGTRIPLATTSMGRAYLAAIEPGERAELLERIRSFDEGAWPSVKRGIDKALEEYAQTGCCSSVDEWLKGVSGIGMPFRPGRGLPVMVVNVGGATQDLSAERLFQEVRPRLIQVVNNIRLELGQIDEHAGAPTSSGDSCAPR